MMTRNLPGRGSAPLLYTSVSGLASNFRCDLSLDTYLKQNKIPGMYGLDTRALTRILRESGTMKGMICYGENIDTAAMQQKIRDFALKSHVPEVSCNGGKVYGDGKIRSPWRITV